ncbi:MarR family winged helix-turn-helix transcriptional regulator [Pseudonocardia spinosispora]|uniref:MarR family winged helix-turn-helix transcriptional regulator n=1 Tax=Pseudonocardia spinosispora TaxID=103441 RepID=UPI000409B7DD|nr:MarR family winged helix-turn-helix transcriptional regulator [Pseudonocardia spinosispora]
MADRAERHEDDPDLSVLAGQLLFTVQRELFAALADLGYDDLKHRHGTILAYLDTDGVRLSELSRLTRQRKQNIGTLVDDLVALGYAERRPDPRDRRAKLVYPTEHGLAQIRAADAILVSMQKRLAQLVGPENYRHFMRTLFEITEHQSAYEDISPDY